MTNKIELAFTKKVTEYLANDYVFHTSTMSGSQGEIAKVDLTNGHEIYRILLDDGFEDFKRFTVLEVRHYEMTNGILWNNKGELIYKERFEKED